MGLLRYITQGFGWTIGAHVAREAITSVEKQGAINEREAKKLARAQAKQARRATKLERRDMARRKRAVEAQLLELKRRAKP